MSLDGLRPGIPGSEQQIESDRVIVPVQEEGATAVDSGAASELPGQPEAPVVEAGAIPDGARPLDTPEVNQAAVEDASQVVAEVADEHDSGPEADQEEAVAPAVVTDPNAEAHNAISNFGTPGGESTLEAIIGKAADKPVDPSGAPVISALEATPALPSPIAASQPVAEPAIPTPSSSFADPYSSQEPKPTMVQAETAAPTSINASGLPGQPSSLVYPEKAEIEQAEVAEPAPVVAPSETTVVASHETPARPEIENPAQYVQDFLNIEPTSIVKVDGASKIDRESYELSKSLEANQEQVRKYQANGKPIDQIAQFVADCRLLSGLSLDLPEAKSGEAS